MSLKAHMRKFGRSLDSVLNTPMGAWIYDGISDTGESIREWDWRRSVRRGPRSASRRFRRARNWVSLQTWLRSIARLARKASQLPEEWRWKYRRQLLRKRLFRGISTYYDPLDEHFRQTDQLAQIFEAAGVEVAEIDGDSTNAAALASWDKKGPKILIDPYEKRHGAHRVNHALFHEMFHLVSKDGLGLCGDPLDPKEILANRFAREMAYPFPAVVRAALNSVDTFVSAGFPLEELLRVTDKQAFHVNVHLSQPKATITAFQSSDTLNLEHDLDRTSLETLLAWAPEGEVRRPFLNTAWSPRFYESYMVYHLSEEGLYRAVGEDEDAWMKLCDSGAFDGVHLENQESQYFWRTISEIREGNLTIRGGNYLGISILHGVHPHTGDNPKRSILFIRDADGALASTWQAALRMGQYGPMLLPEDRLNLDFPLTYLEWCRWIEDGFLKGAPAEAIKARKTVEPILKQLIDAMDEAEDVVRNEVVHAVRKDDFESVQQIVGEAGYSLIRHVKETASREFWNRYVTAMENYSTKPDLINVVVGRARAIAIESRKKAPREED